MISIELPSLDWDFNGVEPLSCVRLISVGLETKSSLGAN